MVVTSYITNENIVVFKAVILGKLAVARLKAFNLNTSGNKNFLLSGSGVPCYATVIKTNIY